MDPQKIVSALVQCVCMVFLFHLCLIWLRLLEPAAQSARVPVDSPDPCPGATNLPLYI